MAHVCGENAFALSIVGSLPLVRKAPNSSNSWRQLREEICEKNYTGSQGVPDAGKSSPKSQLERAVELSVTSMTREEKSLILKLVVLAYGVMVPIAMLANLWEKVCLLKLIRITTCVRQD